LPQYADASADTRVGYLALGLMTLWTEVANILTERGESDRVEVGTAFVLKRD
jgi:hypothetical protein